MKKLYYLFIIFFASAYLNANDHAYGGIPSDTGYLERAAYIIEFDYEHTPSRELRPDIARRWGRLGGGPRKPSSAAVPV